MDRQAHAEGIARSKYFESTMFPLFIEKRMMHEDEKEDFAYLLLFEDSDKVWAHLCEMYVYTQSRKVSDCP